MELRGYLKIMYYYVIKYKKTCFILFAHLWKPKAFTWEKTFLLLRSDCFFWISENIISELGKKFVIGSKKHVFINYQDTSKSWRTYLRAWLSGSQHVQFNPALNDVSATESPRCYRTTAISSMFRIVPTTSESWGAGAKSINWYQCRLHYWQYLPWNEQKNWTYGRNQTLK